MKKYEYEFILYHLANKIDLSGLKQIRLIRVYHADRLSNVSNNLPFTLLLYGNDFLEFKENGIRQSCIDFYIIKTAMQAFLVGIRTEYLDNGTKDEDVIYLKKINSLMSKLLSSKYNMIIYP